MPTEGLLIVTNWSVIWLKEKKHAPISTAFLDFKRKIKTK